MEVNTFKYYAFISYNKQDEKWGKRLQRRLEHFRIPTTLCKERGWKRTPMTPIFFAPTDIQPGGLNKELQSRLRDSRYLIVVGSPNSAHSHWVGEEIRFFHSLGRADKIHYFIVDGIPNSGDPQKECFHPVLKELGMPELLGANIHESIYRWPWLNRERAFVQLISILLKIEFDSIWQRHKRARIREFILKTAALIAVAVALIGLWVKGQPIDIRMNLYEKNPRNNHLPPSKENIINIMLPNETKKDTLHSLRDTAIFTNIPRKYVGRPVRITVSCRDYLPVDTIISLSEETSIPVMRDSSVYGHVSFRLWNTATGHGVPGMPLIIGGVRTVSDKTGKVELYIPLSQQQPAYRIDAESNLIDDTLYMPCGIQDVIIVQ